MRGRQPTIPGMWVDFASAALGRGDTPKEAAHAADAMVKEFYKRYEWYEGCYGEFWKERDKKKRQPEDGTT